MRFPKTLSICLAALLAFCGNIPSSKPVPVQSVDSAFVHDALPKILKGYCSGNLNGKNLAAILKGRLSLDPKQRVFKIDSTVSGINCLAGLDSTGKLDGLTLYFPGEKWKKEQLVPILGYCTPAHWPRQEEGVVVEFLNSDSCFRHVKMHGELDNSGYLNMVFLQKP